MDLLEVAAPQLPGPVTDLQMPRMQQTNVSLLKRIARDSAFVGGIIAALPDAERAYGRAALGQMDVSTDTAKNTSRMRLDAPDEQRGLRLLDHVLAACATEVAREIRREVGELEARIAAQRDEVSASVDAAEEAHGLLRGSPPSESPLLAWEAEVEALRGDL